MRDNSVRFWSRAHRTIYRLTGGVIGGRLVDNDMLLMSTRGFRTGRMHTVPLLYLEDGDCLVVIASYGGRDRNPAWYENLRAEPRVRVQIGSEKGLMLARTATGAERIDWWPRIEAAYPGYATYQSRTDRVIPVVILEPLQEGGDEPG